MRQILPAITMVILLCFAVQTFVNDARSDAANEARASRVRAANAAAIEAVQAVAPTSQPATQPVTLQELMQFAK
ncbi:MAG: hypothetical protein WBD40_05945 [Tepidisphaeraceae bacterium]